MKIPFTDKVVWQQVWKDNEEWLPTFLIIVFAFIWLGIGGGIGYVVRILFCKEAGIAVAVIYIPVTITIWLYWDARRRVMANVRSKLRG